MVIRVERPEDARTGAFIVDAIQKKFAENFRLQRLQNYYEGKHDILLRVFRGDPDKPNNKIVVNYCRVIADFLTAYLVGVPIQYSNAPSKLLEVIEYNDGADTDTELVTQMNIMGFGTELFWTDEFSMPRYTPIDPRESIVIIDDTVEETIIQYIRVFPTAEQGKGYNVFVYTDKDYQQYHLSESVGELTAVSELIPHYYLDVPIVLYENNKEKLGSFEGIMSLQDALNKLVSDELNDFEGFVDAFLVLEGMQATQPEDIDNMRLQRVIMTDPTSKAYWLTKNVNNTHIKDLKASLERSIREMANIPDIENIGALSSGTALRFKLIPTEIQASKQERILKKGIQRKLELLYNIMSIGGGVEDYTAIDVEFERNFVIEETENMDGVNHA